MPEGLVFLLRFIKRAFFCCYFLASQSCWKLEFKLAVISLSVVWAFLGKFAGHQCTLDLLLCWASFMYVVNFKE